MVIKARPKQAIEVSPEEKVADCPYINQYCETKHNSVVKCHWTKEKGRILRSERSFEQGDVIFREPPLHIVAEDPTNPAFMRLKELCSAPSTVFEYEPLWYWTALSSLKSSQLPPKEKRLKPISEDQQRKLLLLYHNEVTEASEATQQLVRELRLDPHLEPVDLERLLQIWILNCFEHSDDPLGYSAYFMSSFMSHSCQPNAVWHYDKDDFVLRARVKIEAQDEICVSYLSEDSLLESVPSRRKHLKDSKHFVCDCARCSGAKDLSRGFRCPACTTGNFVNLSIGMEEPGTAGQLLVGTTCSHCGHVYSEAEAVKLLEEESWLSAKIDRIQKNIEKTGKSKSPSQLAALLEALKRSSEALTQHWLLDRTWHYLSDVYDRSGRPEDAEAYVQLRIEFQAVAYPNLSGARAWTLEAYADMLVRHSGASLDPVVKVPQKHAAEHLAKVAAPVYEKALNILRLMFGTEHDYFTSVQRKFDQLRDELQRHLAEADD